MGLSPVHASLLAIAGLVPTVSPAKAQDAGPVLEDVTHAPAQAPKASFEAPVRLRAGDAFLGEGRYYPSPVLHDVDGDGKVDVVIGDLLGKVTFGPRLEGGKVLRLGAERPLKDRRGEQLKFHNW